MTDINVDFRAIAHQLFCELGQCGSDPSCFNGVAESVQTEWVDAVTKVVGHHLRNLQADNEPTAWLHEIDYIDGLGRSLSFKEPESPEDCLAGNNEFAHIAHAARNIPLYRQPPPPFANNGEAVVDVARRMAQQATQAANQGREGEAHLLTYWAAKITLAALTKDQSNG